MAHSKYHALPSPPTEDSQKKRQSSSILKFTSRIQVLWVISGQCHSEQCWSAATQPSCCSPHHSKKMDICNSCHTHLQAHFLKHTIGMNMFSVTKYFIVHYY